MDNLVAEKVAELQQELHTLAKIAETQPQASYFALVHGLSSKWLYLARTIPEIGEMLQPLESSLHQQVIPAITGREPTNEVERDLMEPPARHGGLSIPKPPQTASRLHQASLSLTSSLIQSLTAKVTVPEGSVPVLKCKAKVHQEARQEARCAAAYLHKQLPEKLQLARALACEKGASSWLTTLPLKVHGFELPKGSFRDALCLRYGGQAPQLLTTCVCCSAMEVEHALSCQFGGLPIRRHNEVRNLLASCLRKAGCDTTITPLLQPLSGEVFHSRRTTTMSKQKCAPGHQGQWILGEGSEEAFFDVRVFNPFAPSYCSLPIPSTYLRHEKENRDWSEERVREVERAAFTPLVSATTGGAGRLTTTFLKRLAACMADQSGEA